MTKYALMIASLLILAGCESSRNGGYSSQSTSDRDMTGSGATTPSSPSTPTTSGSSVGLDRTGANPATGQPASSTANTVGTSTDTGTPSGQSSSSNASTSDSSTPSSTSQGSPALGTTGQGSQSIPNSSTTDQTTAPQSGTDNTGSTPGSRISSTGDQVITQSVNSSLNAAGFGPQNLPNLNVRTYNGRVILSGNVNSAADRQKIEDQVKQTPGVQAVVNQLRVGGAPNSGNTSPNSSSSTLPGTSGTLPNTTTSPSPNSNQTPGVP